MDTVGLLRQEPERTIRSVGILDQTLPQTSEGPAGKENDRSPFEPLLFFWLDCLGIASSIAYSNASSERRQSLRMQHPLVLIKYRAASFDIVVGARETKPNPPVCFRKRNSLCTIRCVAWPRLHDHSGQSMQPDFGPYC